MKKHPEVLGKNANLRDYLTITPEQNNNGEFLRASINHSALRLDLKSTNVHSTLAELRRLMECLVPEEELEDFSTFELRSLLSEEFMSNVAAVEEVKRLLALEERYRVVKEAIPATEEIDLDAGKKALRLTPESIKKAIGSIVGSIDPAATKHALIHLKGLLPANERLIIIDNIHQRLPHVKIRAYQSEQDIGDKVLIEAAFFGEYRCDE